MNPALRSRLTQLETWLAARSKPQLVAGLVALAVLWVGLMSLHLPGAAAALNAVDDGTVKAQVTHLENRNFEISVSLRVTGPDGKVLGGLGPSSFEVAEDGRPVAIKNFVVAGQQPIRACLVIDRSGSMAQNSKLEGARAAALAFLDLMHDDIDHLGLFVFDDRIRQVVPISALDAPRRQRARSAIDDLEPGGGTELFRAVDQALDSMSSTTGRRIVLALTDGKDNASQRGSAGDADRRVDELIAHARKLDIPLDMIGLGNESDIDVTHMRRLAEQTGGRYFNAPSASELAQLYRSIGETLQNEYALTYDSPTPEMDGMTRTVTVAVRRGQSGTVASKTYSVGGVLSGGTTRQRVGGSTQGAGQGQVERASAPFLPVFLPLLVGLGLLFGVPYLRLIQPASAQAQAHAQAAPAQATPAAPAAVPPAPAQAAAASAPVTTPAPAAATQPAQASVAVAPAPAPAPAAQAGATGNACPTCGRTAPGSPGSRYCMICDRTF